MSSLHDFPRAPHSTISDSSHIVLPETSKLLARHTTFGNGVTFRHLVTSHDSLASASVSLGSLPEFSPNDTLNSTQNASNQSIGAASGFNAASFTAQSFTDTIPLNTTRPMKLLPQLDSLNTSLEKDPAHALIGLNSNNTFDIPSGAIRSPHGNAALGSARFMNVHSIATPSIASQQSSFPVISPNQSVIRPRTTVNARQSFHVNTPASARFQLASTATPRIQLTTSQPKSFVTAGSVPSSDRSALVMGRMEGPMRSPMFRQFPAPVPSLTNRSSNDSLYEASFAHLSYGMSSMDSPAAFGMRRSMMDHMSNGSLGLDDPSLSLGMPSPALRSSAHDETPSSREELEHHGMFVDDGGAALGHKPARNRGRSRFPDTNNSSSVSAYAKPMKTAAVSSKWAAKNALLDQNTQPESIQIKKSRRIIEREKREKEEQEVVANLRHVQTSSGSPLLSSSQDAAGGPNVGIIFMCPPQVPFEQYPSMSTETQRQTLNQHLADVEALLLETKHDTESVAYADFAPDVELSGESGPIQSSITVRCTTTTVDGLFELKDNYIPLSTSRNDRPPALMYSVANQLPPSHFRHKQLLLERQWVKDQIRYLEQNGTINVDFLRPEFLEPSIHLSNPQLTTSPPSADATVQGTSGPHYPHVSPLNPTDALTLTADDDLEPFLIRNRTGVSATMPQQPSERPCRPISNPIPLDGPFRTGCLSCAAPSSAYWREPWKGIKLCNGCALRYKKFNLSCSACLHIPYCQELKRSSSICMKCNGVLIHFIDQ